jgi:hypothetical protein
MTRRHALFWPSRKSAQTQSNFSSEAADLLAAMRRWRQIPNTRIPRFRLAGMRAGATGTMAACALRQTEKD